MQCEQKRNRVLHREDQHRFPNTYGELDGRAPMCMRRAVID